MLKKYKKPFQILLIMVLLLSIGFPQVPKVYAADTKEYDFGLSTVEVELKQNTFGIGKKSIQLAVSADKHIGNTFKIKIGNSTKTLFYLNTTPQEISIDDVDITSDITDLPIVVELISDDEKTSMNRTNTFAIQTMTDSIDSIEIVGKTSIYLQDSEHYAAYAKYSDGTSKDITSEATWNIEKPSILYQYLPNTYPSSVIGKINGESKITVDYKGVSSEILVTVKDASNDEYKDPQLTVTSTKNTELSKSDYEFKFTVTNKLKAKLDSWVNNDQTTFLSVDFRKMHMNSNNEFDAFSHKGMTSNEVNFTGNEQVQDQEFTHNILKYFSNGDDLQPGDEITILLKNVRNPEDKGHYPIALSLHGKTSNNLGESYDIDSEFVEIIEGQDEFIPTLSLDPLETPLNTVTDYTFTLKAPRDLQTNGDPNPRFSIQFQSRTENSFWEIPTDVEIITEGFQAEDIRVDEPPLINKPNMRMVSLIPALSPPFYVSQFIHFQSDQYIYEGDIVKVTLKNIKTPPRAPNPFTESYEIRFGAGPVDVQIANFIFTGPSLPPPVITPPVEPPVPPTEPPTEPPVVVPPTESSKGSLIINHVYTDGTVISIDKKENLPLGKYMAEAIVSKDFELVSMNAKKEVEITENNLHHVVNFEYKKLLGKITVIHETSTGEELDTQIMPGLSLKEYIVQAKKFEGYSLVGPIEMKVELTNENREKIVKFTYDKIFGTITVKHVNENDQLLAEDILTKMDLGKHKVLAKNFEGYNLTSAKEKEVVLSLENLMQTVTFKYKKIAEAKTPVLPNVTPKTGTIIVNYVTTEGKVLGTEKLEGLPLGGHKVYAQSFGNYNLIDDKVKTAVLSASNLNVTVPFLYQAVKVPIPVDTPEIEVEPSTGRVFGVVKDTEGNLIEGVVMELHSEPIVTKTNKEGFYEFINVPIGKHTLYIIDPDSLRTLGKIMIEVNQEMFEDLTETALELTEDNKEAEVNVLIEPIEVTTPTTSVSPEPVPVPKNTLPIWPFVVAGLIFLAAIFKRKNVVIYQNEDRVGSKRIGRKSSIRLNITRNVQELNGIVTVKILPRISKKLNENTITVLYKGSEVYTHRVSGTNKDGIEFSFQLPASINENTTA